jgi:hypothetical protein
VTLRLGFPELKIKRLRLKGSGLKGIKRVRYL